MNYASWDVMHNHLYNLFNKYFYIYINILIMIIYTFMISNNDGI